MVSRQRIYELLSRLEKVSVHVALTGSKSTVKSSVNDLQYSISDENLEKQLSPIGESILMKIVFDLLQNEWLTVDISVVPSCYSVVLQKKAGINTFGNRQSRVNLLTALLTAFVELKELEVKKNVAA
ncbi:MAG: hypothetical protein MK111_26120 [Crocosphaera sp.]|uniref:hypothetical protein n=1 Tax=Crocosphaera sp. TaxID=2729996 RepID=UPI002590E6DE|nr:hypothetical protein [Crocosphaera sp.]MCH2248059.1 hypothetical protein [Crocosphaera sp.]